MRKNIKGFTGRWGNRYVEAVRPLSLTTWKLDNGLQDIKPIMRMLKGGRAQKAGIVYLQDEKHEFKVHKNGKLWSVYGSPVTTLSYLPSFQLFDEGEFNFFSGVLNSITGRSIMIDERQKVRFIFPDSFRMYRSDLQSLSPNSPRLIFCNYSPSLSIFQTHIPQG